MNNNKNIHLPIIGHSCHLNKNIDELKSKIQEFVFDVNIKVINHCSHKLDSYLAVTGDENFHISSVRYGLNSKINYQHNDLFSLIIVFEGEHSTTHNKSNKKIDECVFFIPPHTEVTANISGDCSNLIVRFAQIPFHTLILQELINKPLSESTKNSIKHAAQNYIQSHLFIDNIDADKELIIEFKNTIYEIILDNRYSTSSIVQHPNSISELIIEFFKNNITWEYNINELSDYFFIPERTLYWQFKKETKISPYRCYINIKLLQARLDIIKYGKHQSITEIASMNNFLHLSRFSSKYKKFFGELPRETVNRLSK